MMICKALLNNKTTTKLLQALERANLFVVYAVPSKGVADPLADDDGHHDGEDVPVWEAEALSRRETVTVAQQNGVGCRTQDRLSART